jgi:hypothetical protein
MILTTTPPFLTLQPHPPVHAFFQGGPAPGKIAARSRRSARVTRPSARIIDPDNVEASAVTRKRSATVTVSAEASLPGQGH